MLFALLLLLFASDPVSDAVEALQRRDPASAERILRSALKTQPNNADALGLLGVVLDQQAKFTEADPIYRRAIALNPRSTPLLNNYGNHLLGAGKADLARGVFEKVVAIEPAHVNANMQLARIAIRLRQPAEALRCLDRLPSSVSQNGDATMIRMQALYGLHRDDEADPMLARMAEQAGSDARMNFALGTALAGAGQYGKAEDLFSRAVSADPGSFEALYSLGLAASHAGHNERARDILESALRLQPRNMAVLYDLAAVNARLGQREKALELLAQAAREAPDRAEVQQLLARTAADLGYFADAVQAWDRYLRLVPSDDVARRERAFALTAIGDDPERGLASLRAYTAKHPNDAVGHYELAVASAASNPTQALSELDRAIALKRDLTAAYVARALLRFKQADFAGALPDLEHAAEREPNNAVVLDRLGQTYLALDRAADAVPRLRKAAELAPGDSKILMHLGRALNSAGQTDEAKQVFARFREMGPDRSGSPHPPGLVDFLALTPQEQAARYRAGIERTVRSNPNNVEAQVRYLKILLEDGKTAEAADTVRRIAALKPGPTLLKDATGSLIEGVQYGLTVELAKSAPSASLTPDVLLDVAIATSHVVNPQSGLEQLERIPEQKRSADYYLLRAELLDASGKPDEAIAAMRVAFQRNPTRPDLYRWAGAFLARRNRVDEALDLLARGAKTLPDNPDIPLARAVILSQAKPVEADRLLSDVTNRWPDWYRAWLANAVIQQWSGRPDRARQMAETASALGAKNAQEILAEAARISAAYPDSPSRASHLLDLVFR